MKNILIYTSIAILTSTSLLASEVPKTEASLPINDMKEMIKDRIDKRIVKLEESKICIDNAKNKEELKKCQSSRKF